MTDEEKRQLILVMASLGITSNKNISIYGCKYPKAVRELLKKARDYPKEIRISARDNPEVYLKEIKKIAQDYAECINFTCDNPIDDDIYIIIKDIEILESAFSYELSK